MLSDTELDHIAKLVRVSIAPERREQLKTDLSSILDYIEKLNQADTSSVEPLYQTTGLINATRDDQPSFLRHQIKNLEIEKLSEGDVIKSDSTDPESYMINKYGYKRLILKNIFEKIFLNKQIKLVTRSVANKFPTTNIYKLENTENIYALEISGEDSAIMHALKVANPQNQDPEFHNKIFMISEEEFNQYPQGIAYTSISQVPVYSRAVGSPPPEGFGEVFDLLLGQVPHTLNRFVKVKSILKK
ncbi:MAG: Asp-tRNA(Asn)/Glu-tRNA(Gln) amidotransferase subunit GatC [Patescibacteria group bacterium]